MSKDLDFDYLSELFKSDPEEFERVRLQKIEETIQNAPEASQRRLRGIQFQVDAKRDLYKDKPMAFCMHISDMMKDSFQELRYHLNKCTGTNDPLGYELMPSEDDMEKMGEIVNLAKKLN